MAVIVSAAFTIGADASITTYTPDIGTGFTIEDNPDTVLLTVWSAAGVVSPQSAPTSTGLMASAQPNPSVAEYDVQFKVITLAGGSDDPVWCFARWTDVNNYYAGGSYQGGSATDKKIVKRVAGIKTELASGDSGWNVGDTIKFEVRNATKKVFYNGGQVLSSTDNAITATGKAGFGFGYYGMTATDDVNTGWDLDDFVVTTVDAAAAGSPPPLDTAATMHMLVR